jgi:TonB-linked SusC/RagA family outer membrane protein
MLLVISFGDVSGQTTVSITLKMKDASLSEILMEINKKTDYEVQFFSNDVKDFKGITIDLVNVSIDEALKKCLEKTNLTYVIKGKSIVVSKASANSANSQQITEVEIRGRVTDSSNEPLPGAGVMIKGVSGKGVIAGADGQYSLKVRSDVKALLFSYIGYETKEEVIDGRNVINVVMQVSAQQLDNIVITGFQNIPKANFTGSSVKVKSENLLVKGVSDLSRMLEGQVAGVSVQTVSGTFGAAPKVRVRGATSINGENKPLWVIDGVVHEDIVNISNDQLTSGDPSTLLGSAVAGLNANDIESIDVLKDASATALYGARAMNGVIVVTTKRGREGSPVVSYSGNYSLQLKPTYANYDIMNSVDQMSVYAELERKGFLNTDLVNRSNSGIYGKMYSLINTYNEETGTFELENSTAARRAFLERYAYANTDWFDVLFKNSIIQDHSVSISAGGDKSRSYASVSFLNDSGWTVADGVTRYTANLRNDYNLSKKVKLGFQVVGSVRQQKAPGSLSRRSNTVEGSYDRDFDINPFSYALNTSRALTAYDQNGELEYFTMNYAPFNIINEIHNNSIKLNVADLKGQIEAGWQITKDLRWDFTGALRYVKSDREHEIRENSNMAMAYRSAGNSTIRARNKFLYSDPDNPNAEPVVVLPYGGFYNRQEDQLISYDFRNSFVFTKEFGKHSLNVLFGQQTKYADRQDFSMTGYGYQYDHGGVPFVDYRILKQMIESNFDYYEMGKTYDRFAAFYANADYSFDKKYVFSGTVRYDGSNGLGRNASARWLPTWNLSAKWNLSEEDFIKEQSWITYLSLRSSYGLTASMPPSANAAAIFYNNSSNRPYASEIESVIRLSNLENAELTWEKGYLFNVGIDFAILNRRLDIIADFWNRNSFDLISTIRTSGIGGETNKRANYADMKSYGVDLALGIIPVTKPNFEWKINLTYGYGKTKITNAKNQPRIFDVVTSDGGNLEGYPVRSLFSIQYQGLSPETGIPSFIDENGDVSNTVYLQSTKLDNLKYEGPVEPVYVGGISNNFKYKDFTLNLFFTFQGGNKIRLKSIFKTTYSDMDAMPNAFYNRWLMPGDENTTNIPSIADAYIESSELSGRYPYNAYNFSTERVASGDFMRLKTVSLTYNLPKSLLSHKSLISKLTLTLAASNMFLVYSDKILNGQDPEFFNSGGVAQPLQKQFTLALNIGF